MAKFVLTAQLNLKGPTNVAAIAADIRKQLQGAFALDVTAVVNAGKTLDALRKSTDGASEAGRRMGSVFGASLKRFAAFSIATRAVGIFSASLSNAIDEAISYQREVVRLLQVTNNAAGAVKDISDEVTRLATTLGVSSKELISVSNILAQAGLSARDTKIALDSLAKSALAPSFDNIKETAEGVVAIFNQFGAGAEAISGQLGAVNAVAARFAVEAKDLIDVIRTAGGVFKASGGDLNELLAVFTSVRATTRESSESIATGLKTIFTRIQRPATITFLKQFGVELVGLDGKFVGAYEATRRLSEAFSGLEQGDIKFIRIAEELGGYRQIGKVIPLLQQFKIAEEARQVAIKGAGSLDKDAAIAQQALSVQITKVKEEFLALIRGFADTGTFKAMVSTTLSLASAFIKIADAIKPVLPLLAAFAAVKLTQNIGGFFGNIGAAVGAAGASARTKKAKGGRVYGFARGGMVPGSGNGDTVPAMLEPGEFVIRKSSVQSIGQDRLAGMNKYARGGMIQRFATAGLVSQAPLVDDIANTKDAMKPRPGVSAGSPLSEILRTGHGALDFDRTLQRTVGDQAYANAKNDKQKQDVIDRYFANDAARLRDAKSAKLTQFGKELEALIKAGQIDPRKLTLISKSSRTPGLPEHVKGLFGIPLENMIFTSGGSKQPALDAMRSKGPRVDRVQRKALGADLGAIRKMAGGTTDKGVPKPPNIKERTKTLIRRINDEDYTPTRDELASLSNKGKTHYLNDVQKALDAKKGTTPTPKTTDTPLNLGELSKQTHVAAAILSSDAQISPLNIPIGVRDISNSLYNYYNYKKIKGNNLNLKKRDFSVERSGMSPKIHEIFDKSITDNLIESTNKSVAEIKNQLTKDLPGIESTKNIDLGTDHAKRFLASINTGSKGSLFENILTSLQGGYWDDSEEVNPNRNFDFTSGLGPAGKLFQKPISAKYVDAKASEKAASHKSFKTKISNQLALEIVNNDRQLKEGETSQLVQVTPEEKKLKKQKQAEAAQRKLAKEPKKSASGGTSGSTDTIPALLTPGEFVFNSKSARKIGYGNLNTMNKKGVQGFAAGGVVGVQRFKVGGTPAPATGGGESKGISDFAGLFALNALPGIISSISKSADGTNTAFSRISDSVGSLISTVSATMVALTAFGVELNMQSVKQLLGSGKGSAGNLVGKGISKAETALPTLSKGFTPKSRARRTKERADLETASDAAKQSLTDSQTAKTERNASRTSFKDAKGNFDAADAEVKVKVAKGNDNINAAKKAIADAEKAVADAEDEVKAAKNLAADKTAQQKVATAKAAVVKTKYDAKTTHADDTRAVNTAKNNRTTARTTMDQAGKNVTDKEAAFNTQKTKTIDAYNTKKSAGEAVQKNSLGSKFGATKLAKGIGPALAVGAAFTGLASIVDSAIDHQGKMNKAITEGNSAVAQQEAVNVKASDAANSLGKGLIGVGALFGPIGVAVGATAAVLLKVASETIPGFGESLVSFMTLFGGDSTDSIQASAVAQAAAGKSAKEFEKNSKEAAKAMLDVESGAISMTEALKSGALTKNLANSQDESEALQKQGKAEKGNRDTGLGAKVGGFLQGAISSGFSSISSVFGSKKKSFGQDNGDVAGAAVGGFASSIIDNIATGGGMWGDKQDVRNAKSQEKEKELTKKANEVREKGFEAEKPKLDRIGRETILSGGDVDDFKKKLKADPATARLSEGPNGEIEQLVKTYKVQEKAIKENIAYINSLNFGLSEINGRMQATTLGLENLTAGAETGANSFSLAAANIEASMGAAGAAMDENTIKQSKENLAQSLRSGGASEAEITKSVDVVTGTNEIQKSLKPALEELKKEAKKEGGLGADKMKEFLKKKVNDQLNSTNQSEETKARANAAIDNMDVSSQDAQTQLLTGNIGPLVEKVIAPMRDEAQKQIQGPQLERAKQENILIDLTKKKIELESQYISAQKQAIDITLEAAQLAEEFGGKKVTKENKIDSERAKLNLDLENSGIAGINGGSPEDIRNAQQQVMSKFEQQQKQANIGTMNGTVGGAFANSTGQETDKRDQLKKSQESIIDFTRKRIALLKEEISIVQKKNELEKSSLDKLLGGDIEGFMADQAASGAAEALKTGDAGLAGLFSSSALGAGFKSLEGQGLSKAQTERAAGLTLSSSGLNDTRSAQILAKNTNEEKGLDAEGRDLAGVLAEGGSNLASLGKMALEAKEVVITATKVVMSNSDGVPGGAPVMSTGGMVYANRGMFIPRGTDTVPAMLTPGEFVINRASVQRGNNLQLLKAMNSGASNSPGLSRGGKVGYYQEGGAVSGGNLDFVEKLSVSLQNFNTQLSGNIDRLTQTNIQVRLDSANVNVNFNGTGFLSSLTETIRSEVIDIVSRELPKLKSNTSGDLQRGGSVLNS